MSADVGTIKVGDRITATRRFMKKFEAKYGWDPVVTGIVTWVEGDVFRLKGMRDIDCHSIKGADIVVHDAEHAECGSCWIFRHQGLGRECGKCAS